VTDHFDHTPSEGAQADGAQADGAQADGAAFDGAEPLAREALRLVSSVQDWARRNLPDESEHHPKDCQWCPLCQFAAVLRGERPELTERVAEAGAAVLQAMRAMLEAAAAAGSAAGSATGGHHAAPESRPRVQRIDLSGEHPA
jgi:hypothetical protein